MRDPNRIPELLEALRLVWEQDPDLRLAQIVVNAINPEERCPQIFYAEDDVVLKGLAPHSLSSRNRPPPRA